LSSPVAFVAQRDETLRCRIVSAGPLRTVRAGSALLRIGQRLLAIQDDAFAAVWIDPATRATTPLVLRGIGEPLDKQQKPDFEAAFAHDGRIWVLGSGSRPNRCCIARIDLARREAPLLNAQPLYAAIERALGVTPNIEGAVASGDRVRLFQRGPGRSGGGNFAIDVGIDALEGAEPRILGVASYDLGAIGATFLGFTDAILLRKHVVYLAVAEDTPDGIADGAIAGAALGVFDGRKARWNLVTEADGTPSKRKVEGMALDDAGGGWLLTDPDDPAVPAELCKVQIEFGTPAAAT
jgi:hypothetical protein